MKRYINILFFLMINIISISVFAQTYIMPVSGNVAHTTNTGTIYDDGGIAGNYSTRVNAKMTIYPTSPSSKIKISGTYDLEEFYKTKLIIYDGDASSTTVLFSNINQGTSGTVNVTSSTGPITVYFFVDSDNPVSGFVLNISICNVCPIPSSINPTVLTDSTTSLTWNGNSDSWLIHYYSIPAGEDFLIASSTNSVLLSDLTHCSQYGVEIYTPCDTMENSCRRPPSLNFWIQCICSVPLTAGGTISGDTLYANWTSPNPNTEWTVVLTLNGDIIDSLVTTDLSTIFTGVNSTLCYTVYIYENCDNVPFSSICKLISFVICPPCPCPTASNIGFIVNSDSITVKWNEPDNSIEWIVELFYQGAKLSTIVTNDTIATFNDLSPNTDYEIRIYSYCLDSVACPISRVAHTTCACPKSEQAHLLSIDDGIVIIEWENNPNSPGWIVEWRLEGNPTIHYDTTFTNSIQLDLRGLNGQIQVTIHSYCDNFEPKCAEYLNFILIETVGDCFDFTNLSSESVNARFGTYEYPYVFTGLINYGYESVNSRHTVHYDTTERDIRTNNALRTIPQGSLASVRLGNWKGGSQAESITYAYNVDTNNYDLMILDYAIVLQDPNHTTLEQPKFLLAIMDSNNVIIDSVCGYANFIASTSLGWNTVAGSNVIWKDWTKIGFDLSQYHGQTIKVRLTTFDCKEGGHYGYAYYTLNCSRKNIATSSCGETQTNVFSAPEGFRYQWYSSANPSQVLSTDRILQIVTDSSQNYYCIVSSIENPICKFRIDAYGGKRFPLADFTYQIEPKDCYYEVKFFNQSKLSANGIDPLPSGAGCENIKWIFDDGEIQYIDNPTKKYYSSGEHIIKLVAGLSDFQCTDTMEVLLRLVSPNGVLTIVGDSSLCEGESTTLTATMQGNYQWNSSDTTQSISFTPTIDSLYIVKVIDSAGCLNYASKMVRVHPHYNGLIVFDTVCDNYVYDAQGTIITESGTYNLNLISTYGCDSNIVLNLTINPTFYDTSFAVICDNDEFLFQGLAVDSSGTYQVNYNNIYGCDSIYVLHLVVNQTFNDTIYADIYYGNVYKENGFNERTTGFYTHAYQTINGCDSVLNLDLQVDRILFPNVVTPNGDGINDVFNIHNLIEQKAFPDNELFVYNRQGKLIYRFKNISKEEDLWSPSQTNSPTGTYFYRFLGKRHDKTIDLMGAIEVLR